MQMTLIITRNIYKKLIYKDNMSIKLCCGKRDDVFVTFCSRWFLNAA